MEKLNQIHWWSWVPLPWKKWKVALIVHAADDIPPRLPEKYAAIVQGKAGFSWIAFYCPCKRGHRVMVNLDKSRKPYWSLLSNKPLTISPSIDDHTIDNRCHYFVRNGRIKWAAYNISERQI